MSEEILVLFEIMQTTRSMRRLKPDPVPAALIRKILEAGTSAPSGGNMQRWRFLVIRDPDQKDSRGLLQASMGRSGQPAIPVGRSSAGHQSRAVLTDARRGTIPRRSHPRSSRLDRPVYAGRKLDPNGGLINLPGCSEHALGRAGAWARRYVDDLVSEFRERG